MRDDPTHSTHIKVCTSAESVLMTGLDSGGEYFEKEFFFDRASDRQTSLIDLAESEIGIIRQKLLHFSSEVHRLIVDVCSTHGAAATTMAECSPTRDLNPWSITGFADLVCLAEISRQLTNCAPTTLRYNGSNEVVRDSLEAMSSYQGIDFEWTTTDNFDRDLVQPISKLTAFFRTRPLLHLVRALSLRQHLSVGQADGGGSQFDVGLVAPLAHVNWAQLASRQFTSNYWGPLPEKLVAWGAKVVFVHHVSPVLGRKDRRKIFRVFKKMTMGAGGPTHVTTKPHLSLTQAVVAWKSWRSTRPLLVQALTEVDGTLERTEVEWFWRYVAADVKTSLIGHLSLVELASRISMRSNRSWLPQVKQWVVVSENQTWEHDFVSRCRENGSCHVDGFVHTPIRPWDMRYFSLAKEVGPKQSGSTRSLYDRLLVGSPLDRRFLEELVNDPARIQAVESLRFLHRGTEEGSRPSSPPRLIAYGDYERVESETVVRVTEKILSASSQTFEACFQAHPLYQSRDRDLHHRVAENRHKALRLLPSVPVSVVSSRSSVIYSSIQAGHSVVVALGARGLNFCPLPESIGLRFVAETSGDSLFESVTRSASTRGADTELLFLDQALPRWQSSLVHASGSDTPSV